MTVGTLLMRLHLPENHSLKGKRGLVKSVIARVHNRFNVSAAEVGSNDVWQIAEIGVACVSNSSDQANEVLQAVIQFVESERLDAELLDYEIDIAQVM